MEDILDVAERVIFVALSEQRAGVRENLSNLLHVAQ
jgi:hypothetical protein